MAVVQTEPAARRRISWRAIGVVTAIVVAAIVAAWWGIATRAAAMTALTRETRELAVPTVSVIHAERAAPQEEIVLPGSLAAYTDAPIYARTSGYLKRRDVDIGARVKAGQLLAEIDAPELEQQLLQARADLLTAEANEHLAQVTADRSRTLRKTESITDQDYDNAVGTLEIRKAATVSARHNVQRLEQLQGYTKIYAPFAGVITARNTDIGALIDPGASGGTARELFHIAATDKLRVFINVPEAYSRAATAGLSANLTLAEFPGRRFTGMLVRTAASFDASSRTLLTELEVPNASGELLPGAYAEVHLQLPTPASTCILPINALIFRGEGLRVAVVRNSRVVMTPVTMGRDFGTRAEVQTGITAEDDVVVNPPDSLADGQQVRVATSQRAGSKQ